MSSDSWKNTRLVALLRILTASLVMAVCLAGAPPVTAQDDPQVDPAIPLVVINVASIERLMNQAIVTFEVAERPELSETLGGALERVNDLKGLDRDQSIGVMIFLDGLLPKPVGYVPVRNLDDLLKTVEIGPLTAKKTGEDRFEIATPGQTVFARIRDGYAWLANDSADLDREFRDPSRLTRRLSTSYDIAASLNLKSIAPATRELFLNIMRASTENNLQRRDDEPEATHRMRKAAGLRNQEFIDQLVLQGEELTIGWNVSAADKTASLEFVLTAAPNTEFAAYFNELKGHRSRFVNLLSAGNPLTASLTWKLDKSARKMFLEIVNVVEEQLMKQFGAPATEAGAGAEMQGNPVPELARTLRSTIDGGSLDAALQFVGRPPGPFVLVGGVQLAGGPSFSETVRGILERLKSNEAVSDVELNVLSHKGVELHRLEFRRSDETTERIYGGKPNLYLGLGDDVVWFALGGNDATAELKRTIDKAAEPAAGGATSSPFRFVMNFSSWMDVFDPESKPGGFAALARNSFSKGGDSLCIEARPVDDGIRLRVTMDEAFLRLVGSQIARQLDRNQEHEQEQEPDEEPQQEPE